MVAVVLASREIVGDRIRLLNAFAAGFALTVELNTIGEL
jgi:hypothetical protein